MTTETMMNAAQYEITDGYVGSMGIRFTPATAETLAATIAKAAEYSLCGDISRVFTVNPVEPCIEDSKRNKGKYHKAEGRIPRGVASVVHCGGRKSQEY